MNLKTATSYGVSRSEDGAALILALIFLAVTSVIAGALLSYNQVVNKQARIVRLVNVREAGVNSGLDWAIQSLRSGDIFCTNTLTGFSTTISIKNRNVIIYCAQKDGTVTGPGGLAVYVNDALPNSQISTDPTGSGVTKEILGPVYNSRGLSDGWNITAPLKISGEISVPGAIPCGTVARPGVAIIGNLATTYTFFRTCTLNLSAVTPAPLVLPGGAQPGPLDSLSSPGCRIFSPGHYTIPPALSANNFFKSGIYYFEWNGAGNPWIVNSAVRGGDPATGETRESSVPRCGSVEAPVDAHAGVVFVFGRKARIDVRNKGRIELFSYVDGSDVQPGVQTVISGADKNDLGYTKPLFDTGQGSPSELVIHGGVFAPENRVDLRAVSSAPGGIAKILATTVIGQLNLNAPASISNDNFSVRVPSGAGFRRYVLLAVSPGEPKLCASASVTIFNDLERTPAINSWRVDRDPSLDPANCEVP